MIYIVTGHPRSGTNMMMRALKEGGIPPVYDEKRQSLNRALGDDYYTPNPSGFWEVGYDKFTDPEYMANLKDGHCYNVKLEGLEYLPSGCNVVLMLRDPVEIRSSFIALDGSLKNDEEFTERYWREIDRARELLPDRRELWYRDVVFNPSRLRSLGWPLDYEKAMSVINPSITAIELSQSFVQLDYSFDVELVKAEIAALPATAWISHPDGHAGNTACVLVSPGGEVNHETDGEMLPTRWLACCPSVQRIMDSLPCDIERSRFMALDADFDVPLHVDSAPYWNDRVRIHVPIQTAREVVFCCGSDSRHMDEGECWIFDTTRPHSVTNASERKRIHLVMDTRGSLELWDKSIQ